MEIYGALEIEREGRPSGLYRYTYKNSQLDPIAVGACAIECNGHKTKAGAEAHYWEGLVADSGRLGVKDENNQRRCSICQDWTVLRAFVGGAFDESFVLCPAHQTTPDLLTAVRKERNLSAID